MKTVNMNNKCDDCQSQMLYWNGTKICQHRQSMLGEEAIREFVRCSEVKSCEYFEPSEVKCSNCPSGYDDCQIDIMNGKCSKLV